MRILHQHKTKEANLKEVFSIISSDFGVSRAEIARQTNLSKTTVSSLVEELIDGKFIIDMGTEETNKQGRKPNMLAINTKDVVVASILFEENKAKGSLIRLGDYKGKYDFIEKEVKNSNYATAGIEIYKELLDTVKNHKLIAVCFVLPAVISNEKKIFSSINLEDNIIEKIESEISNIPIAFFNKTSCIAYEDNYLNTLQKGRNIYLNLSETIGAEVFYENKLCYKADGMTMQFGHFSCDENGDQCACGNKGCIDDLVSETAINKFAQKINPKYERKKLTYEILGKKADAGDKDAQQVIDKMTDILAFALANMLTIINSEAIIIGGKGVELGQHFINTLREKINDNGFKIFTGNTQVGYSKASYTQGKGSIGGVQYFIDEHYSFLYNDLSKTIIG